MSPHARNRGLRKLCGCSRAKWPKCSHAWHFNFKPRGGPAFRFSLDAELGRHLDSKTEAEAEATRIRAAILAGTFRRRGNVPVAPAAPTSAEVTLEQFASTYVTRAVQASGKVSWKDDKYLLATVCRHRTADGRRLGDWPIAAITEDELEAFHASQRTDGRAASTLNHLVQVLKAAFRWATKKGYLSRSPISDDSALKRSKPAQRARRLPPDEERALLAAAATLNRDGAGLRLSGLIVAALETGCRRGELLGLQWADVDLARRELLVRAEHAKDRENRRLPISTRLAGVLEMARTDPAGREYGPAAYVFGIFGEPAKTVKRAWEIAVLRAHGHRPEIINGGLSPASRAQLAAIDLHFHDLRHEAGSRFLEAGWPVHHVKEMLGHANISQTDTYLNAGRMGLHESMKRFDDARCKPVANEGLDENRPLRNAETEETAKDLLH